jgi:hypothetical protein
MPGRNTAFLSQEQFDQIRTTYTRFNEPWLKEEVEELKAMAADGVSKNDMANQLQRTPNSIQIKLKALGLYVPTPMPPRWTEEDDKKVVDMYMDGCPFEDISAALGRSVNAVISRLIHLRIKIFNDDGR